jgi:hypothetical protein
MPLGFIQLPSSSATILLRRTWGGDILEATARVPGWHIAGMSEGFT